VLPPSAAGRKRSRDEAASNLEDDYFPIPAQAKPVVENEEEWEYGEGMTLIKPKGNGYAIEASSQTGTWAEEKAEEEKAKAAAAAAAIAKALADRPVLRASKSQRLNLSATPTIAEEVSNATASSPGSPERSGGYAEPTIDDFTRHLGIGWSSINSADTDIQAAARGWSKYIENHFPVSNAMIRLQSKALESYLVQTNEGYFLFGEDLKHGRLVSTNLQKTFANLQGPVPTFEGESLMEATASPKLESLQATSNNVNGLQEVPMGDASHLHVVAGREHVMNGVVENAAKLNDASNHTLEVEMDMS
jgi:hypothetical protein